MPKLLMVCLGNICRSPLAEGILRSKLNSNYIVDSAGTSNYHVGESPDKRSIKVAKENGIDISNLKGRQFTTSDFKDFDCIYVMDKSNYNTVVGMAQSDVDIAKVKLILEVIPDSEMTEVPDPYTGNLKDFKAVYNLLNKACTILADRIKTD